MKRAWRWGWWLAVLPSLGWAQVPAPLEPWVGWVMDGEQARSCTLRANAEGKTVTDFDCVSTANTQVRGEGDGLVLSSLVRSEAAVSRLELPGGKGASPHGIRLDGKPAMVEQDTEGKVWVIVPEGSHRLEVSWRLVPDRLAWPAGWGAVSWSDKGKAVDLQEGWAWLKAPAPDNATAQKNEERLEVRVWRLLQDGPALALTTRIELDASGQQRPVTLGPVLPAGFQVTSWSGTGTAVITKDGRLHVRLSPGQSVITVQGQCVQQCLPNEQGTFSSTLLKRPQAPAPWPAQEVWSIQPAPALRQLSADGVGVDPAQSQVPEDWRQWPAYRVGPGQALVLKQVFRGRRAGEGETLTIARKTWRLPEGWRVHDTLTGQLPVGGRLAMVAPYSLGRVEVDGRAWPLTQDSQGAVGMEWGEQQVNASAQADRPAGRAPIAGWTLPVDTLSETLLLPPGQALLAAPEAASGNGSWWDRLSLLTFFGAALFALLIRQVAGNKAAAVAGALALGWSGAAGPVALFWALGLVTVIHMVVSALPAGRLRRFLGGLRPALLGLFVLGFLFLTIGEFRIALHPQLAFGSGSSQRITETLGAFPSLVVAPSPEAMSDSAYGSIGAEPPSVKKLPIDPLEGIGLASAGQPLLESEAVNLATAYHLTYQGPLLPEDTMRVWVLDAWAVSVLRIVGVLALGWLGSVLVWKTGLAPWASRRWAPPRWLRRWGWVACLALLPFTSMASEDPAVPKAPEASVLAELKRRLTTPPACAPSCVTLQSAHLSLSGERLEMTYLLSSPSPTQWVLPVVEGAVLDQAWIESQPAWWQGSQTVALPRGVVTLRVSYTTTGSRLRVGFTTLPLDASQQIAGAWEGQGALGGSLSSGAWVLERRQGPELQTKDVALPEAVTVPSLVSIERTVDLGATVALQTTVSRTSAVQAAVVYLPKAPGETSQNPEVVSQGSAWAIRFAPGQKSATWRSAVSLTTEGSSLTAVPATVGEETWLFKPGPGWTLSLNGVPEASPLESAEGLVRRVLPLPGETLRWKAERLPAAQANLQRLDQVKMESQWGPRQAQHTLVLELFATQAGERRLELPANATLVEVKRKGQRVSVAQQQQVLQLPVERGGQALEVVFTTPTTTGWVSAPVVNLGGPASNVTWTLKPTENRWVLATWGPGWGTVVLYWSLLAALVALAWGLAKGPGGLFPLPVALALVVGFSTFSLTALVLVIAWRLLSYARTRPGWPQTRKTFNLLQVVLALLGVAVVLFVMGALFMGLWGAQPDMVLRAPGNLGLFQWFLDEHPDKALSGPSVLSAPLWVYRALLFVWALWFAHWFVGALKQAFAAWVQGDYWHSKPSLPPPVPKE